eukprot:c46032_g1_i1 orf=146-310(+)
MFVSVHMHNFVCTYRAYEGIRNKYGTQFTGHPTLRKLMESEDQRQLYRFLLEIH